MGHFTFWISLLLRSITETKRLSVGLSPMLSLTNHSHTSCPQFIAAFAVSLFIFELVKK